MSFALQNRATIKSLHMHSWRQNASFLLGLRSFEVCLKWFTSFINAERDIAVVLLFKINWRGNRSRRCCYMQPSCFPWTQPRSDTFCWTVIYKGVQPPWSPNLCSATVITELASTLYVLEDTQHEMNCTVSLSFKNSSYIYFKVFIRLFHRLSWQQDVRQAHGGLCCHLLLSAILENTRGLKTCSLNSISCTRLYGRYMWLSISHIFRLNLRLQNGSSFKQWLRSSTQVDNV